MQLPEVLQMVEAAYDSMFVDDILRLKEFDKFLSVVAMNADWYGAWDVSNLLLYMYQCPYADDLRYEEDWQEERVLIKKGENPYHFFMMDPKTKVYEVLDMFDVSQTTMEESPLGPVVLTGKQLSLAMTCVYNASDPFYIGPVSSKAVNWTEWAKLGVYEDNRIYIMVRVPSPEEKEQYSIDHLYYLQARDMIKCFGMFYFYYTDEENNNPVDDSALDKYKSKCDVLADLFCYRLGLTNEHDIVHFPELLDGKKPELKEFREYFESVLECFRFLANPLETFWIPKIINPEEPVDTTVRGGGISL